MTEEEEGPRATRAAHTATRRRDYLCSDHDDRSTFKTVWQPILIQRWTCAQRWCHLETKSLGVCGQPAFSHQPLSIRYPSIYSIVTYPTHCRSQGLGLKFKSRVQQYAVTLTLSLKSGWCACCGTVGARTRDGDTRRTKQSSTPKTLLSTYCGSKGSSHSASNWTCVLATWPRWYPLGRMVSAHDM